jgi:hypothetical protein
VLSLFRGAVEKAPPTGTGPVCGVTVHSVGAYGSAIAMEHRADEPVGTGVETSVEVSSGAEERINGEQR